MSQVSFTITAGNENFTITRGSEPNTALLRSRIEFDRESRDNYFVTMKAEDGADSSRPGVTGPNTGEQLFLVLVRHCSAEEKPSESQLVENGS